MPSDHDLLCRVKDGDHDAFDALMARHRPAVRARIRAMVRDNGAADDLVQETFLRLWTRADQYGGRGPVGAWLMRIATNAALNAIRSARRRRRRPLQPPGADEDDPNLVPAWMIDDAAVGPDEALQRRDEVRRIRQAVAELSEEKREVLRMVYESDARLADAAHALGVPEGTVKSRLHYAMKTLARALGDPEG